MLQQIKYAVQLKDVSFQYTKKDQQVQILNRLSFSVRRGEFVSIVGASGSGKSTIFRLIAGLEQPDEGHIYLNEKIEQERLGKIGYMPQQDLLMPWRTIRQNAKIALEIKEKHPDEKDLDLLLEDFGLKHVAHKFPHELSGGMRQRVSFLRATLTGSQTLLLDEPFSALDAMTKLHMQEWLLKQWEKQQTTILFITHDISEALFLSDRIFVVQETPITRLQEWEIPLKRPRRPKDLDKQAVLQLKHTLINQFKIKV